jgi:hypothetical protein
MKRTVVLTRPIWVKGKGLPKDGVMLHSEGEGVTVVREHGQDFILSSYQGKPIRIATILSE